jgi:NAD(P)-dependent dehydrogenase (short-subunit alcohol dehydrogenase family)
LINLFLPLVLKGSAKKVISISTGMADDDLIAKYDVDVSAPYSIGKAALNTAIAKFSAAHRKDGVLFISISPGLVDTGHQDESELCQNAMDSPSCRLTNHANSDTG